MNTPVYPNFICSTTGVDGGIPTFLHIDPKHRLWVLVRTASARVMGTHNQCFEQ